MQVARVIYHQDPRGWWAASPDLPGWTGVAPTREELEQLAREGVPFFADDASLQLHHLCFGDAPWSLTTAPSVTVSARSSYVRSAASGYAAPAGTTSAAVLDVVTR